MFRARLAAAEGKVDEAEQIIRRALEKANVPHVYLAQLGRILEEKRSGTSSTPSAETKE